jgi:predicted 2-oxoglutarate/Fe(II)-dependent dioxygenase YbiX
VFDGITITPVFDGTNIITLTIAAPSGVIATFYTDISSTFDAVTWSNKTYQTIQTSDTLDMTINNNIIKTIPNTYSSGALYLTNTFDNPNFRKYRAGYTLDVDVPIDIQLRDERDRIVDLNGANWMMVLYATIHS